MSDFQTWNPHEEELYCLIVLTDEVTEKVLGTELAKGRAYVRAFVLKNRTTGKPRGIWRFHQPSGKNWYQIEGKPVEEIVDGIVKVFTTACQLFPATLQLTDPEPVKCFYPPPGASGDEAIAYLLDHDLVTITSIEEVTVQ